MKESTIQRAILDYLKLLENQGKLIAWRNNSGMMFYKNAAGGNRAIKLGESGMPDIFVVRYPTQIIGLEVKNEKGKLRDSQVIWQKKFESVGGKYYLVRSVEDVEKIINNK